MINMASNSIATTISPSSHPTTTSHETSFMEALNANMIMVLAVLICSLICSLIVNTIIRCIINIANSASRSNNDYELPCTAENPESVQGKRKHAFVKAMPSIVYSAEQGCLTKAKECAICLNEFVEGECLRVLPECSHGFHVHCVDRWLLSKLSCPTCRRSCIFRPVSEPVQVEVLIRVETVN